MIYYQIVSTVLIVAVVTWRLIGSYVSPENIDLYIEQYWAAKGFSSVKVLRLNTTEKLKYGVPPHPFLEVYNRVFVFFASGKEVGWRKVEMTDEKGEQITKYVEGIFYHKRLNQCEAFDEYVI